MKRAKSRTHSFVCLVLVSVLNNLKVMMGLNKNSCKIAFPVITMTHTEKYECLFLILNHMLKYAEISITHTHTHIYIYIYI